MDENLKGFLKGLGEFVVGAAVVAGAATITYAIVDSYVDSLLNADPEEALENLTSEAAQAPAERWDLLLTVLRNKASTSNAAREMLTFSIALRNSFRDIRNILEYSIQDGVQIFMSEVQSRDQVDGIALFCAMAYKSQRENDMKARTIVTQTAKLLSSTR